MRGRPRDVWDAVAAAGDDRLLGRPEAARAQLERLFAQLGAEAGGAGTCLEIGCGAGRMTAELVRRWPDVVAVDVSPALVERARAHVAADSVRFAVTQGGLEGVDDASIDSAVCFGVLQHLPTRADVSRMLREIHRVLRPGGEAFVQLPVLRTGARPWLWRAARAVAARRPSTAIEDAPAYRGARLTQRELAQALAAAGLRVVSRVADHDPTLYSTYPHADDVRLRLARE